MFFKLFISFFLIGLGAYGGGIVTIPLIQYELVHSRAWMSIDQITQILAISQMTPGPIAINAATFTGFTIKGILGALTATIAVVIPSISILTIIIPYIDRFKKNIHLQWFSKGIRLGVLSLIIYAVWSYGTSAIKGYLDFILAVAAFFMLVFFEGKLHPIFIVLICGIIGIFIF